MYERRQSVAWWQHRFDSSSTPGDQHQCPGENCVCKQDCEAESECIGYNAYNYNSRDRCVLYMPLGDYILRGITTEDTTIIMLEKSLVHHISETLAIDGATTSNIDGYGYIGSFPDWWWSYPYFYFANFGECVKKVPMDDAKCKAACGSVACSGYAFSETQCSAAMDALCECTVYTTVTIGPSVETTAQGYCANAAGTKLKSIYAYSVNSAPDCKAYCDVESDCIGYAHYSDQCHLYMNEGTSTPFSSRTLSSKDFYGSQESDADPAPIAGGNGESYWTCYYTESGAMTTDFPKSEEDGFIDLGQGNCRNSAENYLPLYKANDRTKEQCESTCSSESDCIGYTWYTSDWNGNSNACGLYFSDCSTSSKYIGSYEYARYGDCNSNLPIEDAGTDASGSTYYITGGNCYKKGKVQIEPYDYLLYENLDHSAIDCNYLTVSVGGTAGVALATCQTACDAEDNCIYVGVDGASCILYMTSSTLNTTTKAPDTCYGRNSKLLTCSDEVECVLVNIYYTFKQEHAAIYDMHVYRWNVWEDFTFTSRGNTYTQSVPWISRNQSKAIQDLETICTNMPKCIAYAIENDDEYSIITNQFLHSENSPTTMEYIGAGPCNNNPHWYFGNYQVPTEQKCRELCSGYGDCVGYDFKITGTNKCRMYTRNMCDVNTGLWVGNINASAVSGYLETDGYGCQRGENIVVYDISGSYSDYSCYAKRKVHSSFLYVGQMTIGNTFQIDMLYFNKVVADHLNPKAAGTLCISGQCNDGTCCDGDSTTLCSSVTCSAGEERLDSILCGDQCNSQTCCQENKCNNVDCGDSKLKKIDGTGTTEAECCRDIKTCDEYCLSGVISGRENDPIPNPFLDIYDIDYMQKDDDVNFLYCCACQKNQYLFVQGHATRHCEDCDNNYQFSQGGAVQQCESCPDGKRRYQHSDGSWDETCNECDVSQALHNGGCTTCPTGSVPKANRDLGCETCGAGNTNCISSQWGIWCSGLECEPCPHVWNYIGAADRECKYCPNHQIVDKTSNAEGVCTNCPIGYDRYTQHDRYRNAVNPYCFTKAYTDIWFTTSSYDDCSESQLTTCTACATGRFSITPGAQCQAKQTCASGQFVSAEGSTTVDRTCENCPSGWVRIHNIGAGDADACKACPAGYYQDEAGQETSYSNHALACKTCPEGYYSGSAGASECGRCPFGSYPINEYGQSVLTQCETCNNGYSDGYISDSSGCIACPAHQEPNSTGNGCEDKCPSNQVHSNGLCIDCEGGRYRGASSTQCEDCTLKGGADDWLKYQDQNGQTSCKTCPNGYYATQIAEPCLGFLQTNNCDPTDSSGHKLDFSKCADTVPRGISGHCKCQKVDGSVRSYEKTCQAAATNCDDICAQPVIGGYTGCAGCSEGRFFDDNVVRDALDPPSSRCTACPDNTVTTSTAPVSINACLCDQHYYGSSGNCMACPDNSHTTSTGSVSINACLCDQHYYGSSGNCTACPGGWYQDQIYQSECKQCNPNQFGVAGGDCQDCPAGYGSTEGVDLFTEPCLGFLQTNCYGGGLSGHSLESSKCATTVAPDIPGYCKCRKADGYVRSYFKSCQSAATNCNDMCAQQDIGGCDLCAFGKFSDTAGQGCQDCPAGRYGIDTTIACNIACPPGYSTGNHTDASKPHPLTNGVCFECLNGYIQYAVYSSEHWSNWDYSCQACPLGRYADDHYTCKTCPAGKMTSFEASFGGCSVSCAAGTYSTGNGAPCLECDVGTYNTAIGQSSCSNCFAGETTNGTAQTSCIFCAEGKFSNGMGGECQTCPANHYTTGNGEAECLACPAGYQSNDGTCTACPSGQHSDAGGSCVACLSGTFTPPSGDCEVCPTGFYSEAVNSQPPTACTACAAGQFNNQTIQSACVDCPVGTSYNDTGATVCDDCEPGKYNDQTGLSTCKNCQVGRFMDEYKALECEDCGIHHAQSAEGQTLCALCNETSYQTQTGQAQCIACGGYDLSYYINGTSGCLKSCEAGQYNQDGTCEPCPALHVAPLRHIGTSCSLCQEGQVANDARVRCENCPQGTYFAIGQCLGCPEGKYQDEEGQLTCKRWADPVFNFADVHPEKTGLCPYTTTHYRDSVGCRACKDLQDGYFCQRYLNGRYPTLRQKVHQNTKCHGHFKLNDKVCSETECEPDFALVGGHCVACSVYERQYNELTCSSEERSTYKEIIEQYCQT